MNMDGAGWPYERQRTEADGRAILLGTLDEVITFTLLRSRVRGHGPVTAAAGLARAVARRHASLAWYAPRARDAARARHAAGPRDAGRTRNATYVRLSPGRRSARRRRPAAGYRCGRTPPNALEADTRQLTHTRDTSGAIAPCHRPVHSWHCAWPAATVSDGFVG